MTEQNTRLKSLFEANSAALLGYFARRIDTADDAADLLSETMVVTWRRIRHLPDNDEAARMWMFGTAKRVLANYRRGRRRHSALADRLRLELAVLEVVPLEDDFEHVAAAVAALPANLAEIVRLRHWEGFSLAQVAAILGVQESTVRTRYSRARDLLVAALSEQDLVGS